MNPLSYNSILTLEDQNTLMKWVSGATPLGESSPEISELKESQQINLCEVFTNYDMSITITLKGSNRYRLLEGNLLKQYELFKNIISNIIDIYGEKYIFYFETHKCGLWLHTHGIIKVDAKNIIKIKREVYEFIENRKIEKYRSYKHRIYMKKVECLNHWIEYIQKDEKLITGLGLGIGKIYKLFKNI